MGMLSGGEALLERGADQALPDGRGALALAVASSDPQVLRLLLNRVTRRSLIQLRYRWARQECFDLLLHCSAGSQLGLWATMRATCGQPLLLGRALRRHGNSSAISKPIQPDDPEFSERGDE
jgi:hypothetical protein